ncbi:MAG: hypothetical protein DMD90_00265 [Candidatus Rokuibacteriota bacterium]|nr:MAG: hypothetical protein DMD90_00265 [Candidatus Rokubacteria bacterium]
MGPDHAEPGDAAGDAAAGSRRRRRRDRRDRAGRGPARDHRCRGEGVRSQAEAGVGSGAAPGPALRRALA